MHCGLSGLRLPKVSLGPLRHHPKTVETGGLSQAISLPPLTANDHHSDLGTNPLISPPKSDRPDQLSGDKRTFLGGLKLRLFVAFSMTLTILSDETPSRALAVFLSILAEAR